MQRNFILSIGILFLLTLSLKTNAQVNFLQGCAYVKVKPSAHYLFHTENQRPSVSLNVLLDIDNFSPFLKYRAARPTAQQSIYEQEVQKIYKVCFSESEDVLVKVEALKSTGLFDLVEPSYIFDVQLGYQPNDPFSDSTLAYNSTGMNQLLMHDFYSAWAVEKGDTNVVIGVVDTGVNFNQTDSKDNLKYNFKDPINGLNDDGDQYDGLPLTDNFRGWDVADWDNDPTLGSGSVHGASMVSIIAATPDNNLGIIGTGFNCKYIPYKAAKNSASNSLTHGYDGLYLAALQGAKVINCSWGNSNVLPQIFGDIVQFCILDLDAVVVSSAGNEGNSKVYYPASFPLVISTSALMTDSTLKLNASNYNYHVDIAASGDKVLMSNGTTSGYKTDKGTSVSAAVVSGLMGLIRSHFPEMSSLQARQQLKVTATYIDKKTGNLPYSGQIGKMIHPLNALIDTVSPGIFAYNQLINGGHDEFDKEGELVSFDLSVVNLLRPSKNITYTLSAVTPNFSIVQKQGVLANLGTMDTLNSLGTSIELDLKASSDTLENYILRIDYTNGFEYKDHDYIFFSMKPTEVTAVNNLTEIDWKVYPVPFQKSIFVEGDFAGDVEMDLLNTNGVSVFHSKFSKQNHLEFVVPDNIDSGTYFLRVKDSKNTLTSKVSRIK